AMGVIDGGPELAAKSATELLLDFPHSLAAQGRHSHRASIRTPYNAATRSLNGRILTVISVLVLFIQPIYWITSNETAVYLHPEFMKIVNSGRFALSGGLLAVASFLKSCPPERFAGFLALLLF